MMIRDGVIKFINVFLVMVFACSSALGVTFNKNDERIDSAINKAEDFLDSESAIDQQEGERELSNLTGNSVKARFFLGLWLIQNPEYNHKKLKAGISLIESAHYENYTRASYFMMNVYKGTGNMSIFKMLNNDKAIAILKKILDQKKGYSADDESILGLLLLRQDAIKNKKEAISWLEKSVAQGETISVSLLAPLFTQGEEKDLVKAWFYSDLGGTSMASEKHALEDQMTSKQIEQAQQMSWAWQDAHHVHMPGYHGQASRIRWHVESD